MHIPHAISLLAILFIGLSGCARKPDANVTETAPSQDSATQTQDDKAQPSADVPVPIVRKSTKNNRQDADCDDDSDYDNYGSCIETEGKPRICDYEGCPHEVKRIVSDSESGPRPFRFCVKTCHKHRYVIPIVKPDEYDLHLPDAEEQKYVVQYDVDCDGDGEYEKTNQTGDVVCDLEAGIHHIGIRGTFPGLKFDTGKLMESDEAVMLAEPLPTRVIAIEQWGDIPWRNLSAMFTCDPADILVENACGGSPGVQDGVFNELQLGTLERQYNAKDAPKLKYIRALHCVGGYTEYNGNFGDWDVSGITDMSEMFRVPMNMSACGDNRGQGIWSFNQNLSKWNTSHVEKMDYMFLGCEGFNQDISMWNTSNVRSMRGMFHYAATFNQPIGKWNVSNVTDMHDMFYHAMAFNQSLEDWNISKVKDMSGMFDDAFEFNQSLKRWDVKNINTKGMFVSDFNKANAPKNYVEDIEDEDIEDEEESEEKK